MMTPMPTRPPRTVPIPGGDITLRDARSGQSRVVSLRSFEIGDTPVTRGQFAAAASVPESDSGAEDERVPQHPVTWFEAVEWCNAASAAEGLTPAYVIDGRDVTWRVEADGYRLPTEAEWEFACRAGASGPHYGELELIAWTAKDAVDTAQPVARKAPNAFGLHDTLGNVWEWCWDFADTARYLDYRTLRGGGFADREWSVRASVRRACAPDGVLDDVGFRVARGAVAASGEAAAQGWSAEADRRRADVRGPLPMGWTPHRALLG